LTLHEPSWGPDAGGEKEVVTMMMFRHSFLALGVLGLTFASVSACDGNESDGDPSATVAPSAAAPTEETSDSAEVFPEGEPLDFVLLADSGGAGVAEPYAAKAAEALDREVRVRDHTVGGATADFILSGIRHSWADEVADAEIIMIYMHPGGFEPSAFMPCLEAVNSDSPVPPSTFPPTLDLPEPTTVEDWQGYRDTLDQIYDEIWKLRAGQPTILRAYGVYLPWLGQWRHLGIESACVASEEAVDQARRQAAEAHGAIFVSAMDVFNGPGHDEDAVEKGLVQEDGMHLNEAGASQLVDALAAAGFEPSGPPA
jgi:hypothetical protein